MEYEAKSIYLLDPDNRTMQDAIKAFLKIWLPYHSSYEELKLYHYTSLEGLRGILSSQSLWFTDASFMNDPLELKYGAQLIINNLNEKLKKEQNPMIKELIESIIFYINAFDDVLYKIFISCFCEAGNLLSQWRAYSRNGMGYNIGFKINSQTDFSHNSKDLFDTSHIILRKVVYNEDEQSRIVSTAIETIINEANKVMSSFGETESVPQTWPLEAGMESVNIFYDIIMTLKNPVFKEENEWRFIIVFDPDRTSHLINFRNVNHRLSPYVSTYVYESKDDIAFLPISSITFGPALEQKGTKKNIELLIKTHTINKNRVMDIPENIEINGAGYSLQNI